MAKSQSTLSFVNRANLTLQTLVSQMELSPSQPSSSSPTHSARLSTSYGSLQTNTSISSPSPLRQLQNKRSRPIQDTTMGPQTGIHMTVLQRPPTARRVIPKAKEGPLAQPVFITASSISDVSFASDAAPIGMERTMGVFDRVRADSEGFISLDVPDDLQQIISTQEDAHLTSCSSQRQHSYDSANSGTPASSPSTVASNLPSPPTTSRASPRNCLTASAFVTSTSTSLTAPGLGVWHLGPLKTRVDDSDSEGCSSPQRESGTFDFTGELDKLQHVRPESFLQIAEHTGVSLPENMTLVPSSAASMGPIPSPGSSLGQLRPDFKFGGE